jgi:hypothetical protein
MTLRRLVNSFVIENLDEFPKEEIPVSMTVINEDDTVFKKYILNSLEKRKSKMITLILIVGNTNNYTGYSVFSDQSEAVELGYEFGVLMILIFYSNGKDILIDILYQSSRSVY